jgi:hypothetical protein
MSDIFEGIFSSLGKSTKPSVDPAIAASVWMEKTPIFKKLPSSDDETIKIKAGDFKRVMRQAFVAGFERGSK